MAGGGKFAQFGMTGEEKRMLALVVFLAILGLAGRYWYLRNRQPQPYTPPDAPPAATSSRATVEER